ncbi:MAG: hypothetical protein J6X88_02580 [Bacteroidales bacterium]|nr:hypothetical protein [Bacteroidales bacterium]
MKKTFIFVTLLAAFAIVNAQTTYHVVYIPGDGERQFGFSLAPSFCGQHLGVNAQSYDANTHNTVSYPTEGLVTNSLGINAGLFYGYETLWGNFIEWGNYSSVYYGLNPFSGEVTITRNGVAEKHNIQYTEQHITLHFNPFISHRFGDQLSVSLGLGLAISPRLPIDVQLDGNPLKRNNSFDESMLINIFNISFDANACVKYWFSDEWFVGFRFQYGFASLLDLFSNEDTGEILDGCNGAINLNMDKGTARCTILPKNAIQTVFSIGYNW